MANTWDSRPINTGYTVVDGTTTGNYNNGHPETIVHTWMEYQIQTHTAADELANQTRIDIKLYSEVHQPQGSGSGMSFATTPNNYGYAGWDGGNRTPYNCTYDFNNYARVTFFDGMITVPHNADGSKTITLEAGFNTLSGTWAITGGSASVSVTLPTIANKTEIVSVSGTNFGFPTTVQLSRKASNLHENAVLGIGGTNIQVKSVSNESADFTFVLDRSYAPATALPCSLTGTLAVETFNGATSLGTVYQSVTFTVSQNDTEFAPTLSAEPTVEAYNTDGVSALGTDTAVATYSKINVKAAKSAVSLKYGATIAQRYVEFQDGRRVTADQTNHISNVINSAGSYGWRYVVVDSRGFTVSPRSGSYQVINASMPTVEQGAVVYRGESDGTPSESGTYIFAQATARYDSLNGHNSATMTARVGSGTSVTLTDGVRATLKTDASPTQSYVVTISVTDILTTNNLTFNISSASVPIHIREYGNGVGIGKYCEHPDTLEIGFDTAIEGELTIDGNIFVEGAGTILIDNNRVLTEDDIPITQDMNSHWNDSCSTALSPSSCLITVPATRGGLYTITAKCMNDNGTPQEVVVIKYESGGTNIEQIVRQEMGATGLGSCPLNASAVFRINGGDTIQIYCRYSSAGMNNLYLTLHQIGN